MPSTLTTLIAIAGLSQVRAQLSLFTCDGLGFPDIDICENLMGLIPWSDNSVEVPHNYCAVYNQDNCRIEACNWREDGNPQSMPIFSGPARFTIIKSNCLVNGAGGAAPVGGPLQVRVRNNPEYHPPSRVKRGVPGPVESSLITIEESDAAYEAEKKKNALKAMNPRGNIQKRDPEWIHIGTADNVRRDGHSSRMSAVGGSGTEQSWSTTEGFTSTVGMSVEMGVNLFEIFTASMSLSVEMSYSVEHTETVTFSPKDACDVDQTAVLYYYPWFTKYTGMWSDERKAIDVWIPKSGAGDHSIEVQCLGG